MAKNSHKFFENKECRYFPRHEGVEEFNCLFCYCPLYSLKECAGNPGYREKGEKRIKVCTECIFPHRPENYEEMMEWLKKSF